MSTESKRPSDFDDWPEVERDIWCSINGTGLGLGSYPPNFWSWSRAKRDQYFSAQARAYRASLKLKGGAL